MPDNYELEIFKLQIYWTLYIIKKLKILSFQKFIKKALAIKVYKRILTKLMSKLQLFSSISVNMQLPIGA